MDSGIYAKEKIESILVDFEVARLEAQTVGFDVPNFQILGAILLRTVGVGPRGATMQPQPFQGRIPLTQAQRRPDGTTVAAALIRMSKRRCLEMLRE